MKVALIARSSLYETSGGDTTQVLKTAAELQKRGISAEVFLSSQKIPHKDFDLLHFFNIIRPADHLYHIKKSRKPYLVSTIYLDYSEFDRFGRGLFSSHLLKILGRSKSEYIKNVLRYVRKQDRLVSREYLLGHKRSMQKVLENASMILPNSASEYRRLSYDLNVEVPYHVVPNGIDAGVFGKKPEGICREQKVICVAQVYGMKNQHALIEVCNALDVPLEIIGKAPPNHKKYYDYCRRIASNKVKFYDFMPQEDLVKHYASAKVHALPSWFETTGLSSLEAGAMGCSLVVGAGGDTRDYFDGIAHFCSADDMKSIQIAVEKALTEDVNPEVRNKILSEFTWKRAAEATLSAYKKVMNNES
ncbi:MAG: glycosyltransferase family 4 protein [Bacteroidales bacterium]|nr:glycosyltransferase family 4 protein [Bacteroidales bacterium]MCF8387219.1 glycosyltransferase family 4 protein [Bacteroidales bacterium]MCF8397867.1 glycosyltransferase family 4 protein [Bacteroidales bacterium]